jgi:hypothetical protein
MFHCPAHKNVVHPAGQHGISPMGGRLWETAHASRTALARSLRHAASLADMLGERSHADTLRSDADDVLAGLDLIC